MKKILFIPPGIQNGWYMENHYEYLIRYLSDEFFIEQAQVPYPPFENFLDRYPATNPLERNPEDYDLIVPLLPSHAGVPTTDEWFKKMAIVMYEPGEGHSAAAAHLAGATPYVDQANYEGRKCWPVRFGVDTDIYKPYPMLREDDLLHVGIVGSHATPRRMIEEAIKPLYNLEGVRIMFFPSPWINNGDENVVEKLGGQEFLKRCVSGNKRGVGIANMYNQLDVLIRCDASYGYSFPVMEAAACGVPVIATDCGIDHFITQAGGGILIEGNPLRFISEPDELRDKVRKAIIWMRDNPIKRGQMGKAGRAEVVKNWTWPRQIPAWRRFLREATR